MEGVGGSNPSVSTIVYDSRPIGAVFCLLLYSHDIMVNIYRVSVREVYHVD